MLYFFMYVYIYNYIIQQTVTCFVCNSMMESPEICKRKRSDGDISLPKINCTPKNQKMPAKSEEFCLYKLHRESSPNFRAGQDVLEVGWGDSPEPLDVEQRFELDKNSIGCKKKLDTKESPKSSIPCKRRNIRSTFNLPSKSFIDVAKYVAEVQELSKNIMKEFNAKNGDKDIFADERFTSSTEVIEKAKFKLSPSVDHAIKNKDIKNKSCENKDLTFDTVLQTFINEEDDWLSQALSSQETAKTPHKSFVKSKSENELKLPKSIVQGKKTLTQTCRNNNNIISSNGSSSSSSSSSFRRTSSFDLTKPHNYNNNNDINNINNNNNNIHGNSNQYSLQEIERKRLEAKYRRERREIERKKLEALKKLEMKKLRPIKT